MLLSGQTRKKQAWGNILIDWQHCTALHCTTLHCTALHCPALYYTTLHCIVHTILYCAVLYTKHCIAHTIHSTLLHCSLYTYTYNYTYTINVHIHIKSLRDNVYGIKCVGRIVTKSMSNFLHLCDYSVPYCAYLEAWNWLGAGQHFHASHPRSSVWPIPKVTLFLGNYF